MKYLLVSLSLIASLLATTAFSQQKNVPSPLMGTEDIAFPTVESMFSSLTSEAAGKEVSLTDSVDKMMQSMSAIGPAENTTKSVQSAVSGNLIVVETIPDTNQTVVESIDKKTNRYSPRLKIDFASFPLARPASVEAPIPTERIAKHLQQRLRLDQPIEIEFLERTACLRGTVSTQRHKELAEMILRLEPGVDTVKNELVVDAARVAR